jgi:hypothetical protein
MYELLLTAPYLPEPPCVSFYVSARGRLKESRCLAMTTYFLIAVLAVLIFLSFTGDGTGRSAK